LGVLSPRQVAVVLSAYASLIHNWVLPEHYQEWWGYGLFFLASAVGQAFYAGLLLVWPRGWIFRVGIAANSAILVLYAVTRTLGVPVFGPHAGLVEPIGVPDLASAIAELALIVVLVRLARATSEKGRTHAATLEPVAKRPDQADGAGRRIGGPAAGPSALRAGRRTDVQPAGATVRAGAAHSTGAAARHHNGQDPVWPDRVGRSV
jgi:hypothetical protein